MKRVQILCAVLASLLLFACGNGSPQLTRVSVTPVMVSSSIGQQVRFSATGQFDNNKSRMLGAGDALQWTSDNPHVATVDQSGVATCISLGSAPIRATAAVTTQKTVSSNGSTTSSSGVAKNVMAGPTVSGAATLTCL